MFLLIFYNKVFKLAMLHTLILYNLDKPINATVRSVQHGRGPFHSLKIPTFYKAV